MPTPLTQLLPQIVTLNVDSEPFAYYATGNQIIGWWDIAKVTTLYPTEVDHVDESYRLAVTLDERNGSYKYVDHSYKAETRAGFGDGGSFDGLDGFDDDDDAGTFTFGKTYSWSFGHQRRKEWHYEWGGLNRSQTPDGDSGWGLQPVVYSFDTDRIKTPLFNWLQSHGWQQRSGFFG